MNKEAEVKAAAPLTALEEPPVVFEKLPIDKVTTTSIMIFFQQEGERSKLHP